MRWRTVRACVVEPRSSRRHSASRSLNDRRRQPRHGPQAGRSRCRWPLPRFQLAQLSDQRGGVAAGLDGGNQTGDPLLDVLLLAHQLVLQLCHVVTLREVNHLLDGFRGERVLLDRLKDLFVHVGDRNVKRVRARAVRAMPVTDVFRNPGSPSASSIAFGQAVLYGAGR